MKRNTALWFLLCTSAALFACKKSSPPPEAQVAAAPVQASQEEQIAPPPELPLIWFHPVDGSTGVGAAVAEIRVEGVESVDARLLQALEESVRLETASGEVLRFQPVASRQEHEGARADITILPEEPLGPGAYVLRLARLPVGVEAPQFPSHTTLADGSIGVRFRVDSAPSLWGIRVCEKETGSSVIVEFSEKLLASESAAKIITLGSTAGAIACSPLPHGNTETVGSLAFACEGLDPDAELEVTIAEGMQSPSGVKLASSTHQFVPAELAPWGSGCKLYRSQP